MKLTSLLAAIFSVTLLAPASAQAFAREFTQDRHPGVFHAEKSSAKLCLFVYRRQGALMIQPHCMVSISSHQQASLSRAQDKNPRR